MSLGSLESSARSRARQFDDHRGRSAPSRGRERGRERVPDAVRMRSRPRTDVPLVGNLPARPARPVSALVPLSSPAQLRQQRRRHENIDLRRPISAAPKVRTLAYRQSAVQRSVASAEAQTGAWKVMKKRCAARAIKRLRDVKQKEVHYVRKVVQRYAIYAGGTDHVKAQRERSRRKAMGELVDWNLQLCFEARAKILGSGALFEARSPAEVDATVSEAFKVFDLDGDGALNRDEMRAGLIYFRIARLDEKHLDAVFDVMDTDRSGGVDAGEFRAWIRSGTSALARAAACAASGRRMSEYGRVHVSDDYDDVHAAAADGAAAELAARADEEAVN